MSKIVEGVETILNDDGSYTTYTVEHFPYQEPMSPKSAAILLIGTVGLAVAAVVAPVWLENRYERREEKKLIAQRQKKNREIFYQAKNA